VPRIGITGHSNLTAATVPLVAEHIRVVFEAVQPDHLTGLACLARGADQVFARVVGGTADVVAAATKRGIPVTVIWPDGAQRQ
jgi:hypothetical protein